MQYVRQSAIIPTNKILSSHVSLVGCGAIGSWAALTIAKMGLGKITLYDPDRISEVNLPNQFYPKVAVGQYKVAALKELLSAFADTEISCGLAFNESTSLFCDTVIVATDSMSSRKMVWESFLEQDRCKNYIEARMGGELGIVYTIKKKFSLSKTISKTKKKQKPQFAVSPADKKFYEETLYSDEQAVPQRCTAKAIMYNVNMISALIGRAFASVIRNDNVPREMVFSMVRIDPTSWMVRA